MLLGHRSKNPPLIRFACRREFTMARLLCQIANITVHYLDRELARALRSLAPGSLSTMGFLGLPVLMGGLLPDGPMIATRIYIVLLLMRQDTIYKCQMMVYIIRLYLYSSNLRIV